MRRNLLLLNLALLLLITASSASAQATPVPRSADEGCAQIIGGGTQVPTATADSEVDLAGLDFDLIFLDAMIPHVQNAVDMAIVANERSTRSEITDFTAQEMPIQQAQVDAMRLWREEWYPDTPALTQSQL